VTRRLYLVVGVFLLLSPLVLVAVFGLPGPLLFARIGLATAGGLAFVVGALRSRVRVGGRTVPGYALVGFGDVLVGLSFVLGAAAAVRRAGPAGELFGQAVPALGGLVLMYIGYDFIRGGRHFDVSQFE